jgi:Na+/glutamate symporter
MHDDRWNEGIGTAIGAATEVDAGFGAVAAHHGGESELACIEARLALACALFGLLFAGFIFGPLALSLGQRAQIRIALDPDLGDQGLARAARLVGKFALGLHLTLVIGTLGWLFFSLPCMGGAPV